MSKKTQHDERGVAQILLVVFAVVVIAAVAFAGWKVADNKKSPASSSSSNNSSSKSNPTVSSGCVATYHDNTLCKFEASSTSFDKTAYTATLKVDQQGTNSTMTLASDGKGNTKLSTTSGGQTLNSITLDGNTYIQTGGSGPWIEYPSGASAPTSNPTSNMNITVGSAGISFKALGTASCGNLTCYKYQVTDTASPSTTQYVWFDNSNYNLREWQDTDGSGNTTDMTISYQPVNITKPSPVQSYTTPAQ